MEDEKHIQSRSLAEKRRNARWEGYANIGDFHDGRFDCAHVSPYTKRAGNVDSDIFILLQDWCSADFLSKPYDPELAEIGRAPNLPTNRNLDRLLQQHFDITISDVFATNLFPFIKPAEMSASIPTSDLVKAAREYALPQVEIVQPRLVIVLGLVTFNAIHRAVGYGPISPTAKAIERPFDTGSTRFWCQAHTGALGKNNRNRGGIDRVTADWEDMEKWYVESG